MNRYRAMTWVLVISNIIMLVSMFIAAFWGFTYPEVKVDGYHSGKSAFVAAFMCFLAGICLCGLNFQNYYLLCVYAVLHVIFMLNQLFSLLPFDWTRIPNYPLTGKVSTQVYIMLAPKLLLVIFAFLLALKLRTDEKRYELASSGGLHQRLPCHIVPRNEPGRALPYNGGPMQFGPEGHMYGAPDRTGPNGTHLAGPPMRMMPGAGSGPPPLPPSSSSVSQQIIQTPPIYPLHRPSVTDVSINSPNRPLVPPGSGSGSLCHRSSMAPPMGNCPPHPSMSNQGHSSSCGTGLNGVGIYDEHDSLTQNRSSGVHWRSTPYDPLPLGPDMPPPAPSKWWSNSAKHYPSYYRDVYNPNF